MAKPRVLVICDGGGVSEFYRAATPYSMLAHAGYIDMMQDNGLSPAIIDHLAEFDAVVFSRSDSEIHSLILLHAKMLGKRIIYDVDDNLILIPPSIQHYGAWHELGTGKITPRLWHFKKNIRLADVLTVSTAALGRQLCDGQPHRLRPEGDYLVLPNQILATDWAGPVDELAQQKQPGEVWVGWWGIYNHWDDWRDIAPYIEPVIAERPNVKLVILGMPELGHLFPKLRVSGQLIVGPFMPTSELAAYRDIVKQFDVALAPTAPCPFNESKSDLKILQYGAAGAPVIASAVTYSDWDDYVLTIKRPDLWGTALDYMLSSPEAIKHDGAALREAVLTRRTYEQNYTLWLKALGVDADG